MAEESKLAEKLEEKEKEVKFSEEEMTKLQEIRNTYSDIQYQLGNIALSKIRIEQQITSIDETENQLFELFEKTQTDETTFLDEINEKYGQGELDPQTGIFYKNNSK